MARPLFIVTPGPGGEPVNTPIEQGSPLIYPPKDLKVKRDGGMVRLVAIERGKFIATSGLLSGAVQYIFYWVAEADVTTQAGRKAALARAEVIGIVARTYVDDQELPSGSLADARFASGFFMCAGSNGDDLSDEVIFSASQTGDILDGTIPGPITDLQISEEGEQANGTVVSVLDFTYVAPNPKNSFIGIQPVIADYPAIGDLTEFGPLGYGGPAGGAGGGLLRILPARRTGDGTITITTSTILGTGTHFTLFAKAGDQIEVFGVRRRIFAVNNDVSITLFASWPTDPAVTNVGQYVVIGNCRIYAVSLSQTFAHSADQSTWPFVDVDLDGELSPPNAPAVLTLTPFGNGIRGQFAQVAGVGIRGYLVFRSTGVTNDISTATQIGKEIRHDPTTPNGGTVLQFEDTNFSVYEREHGQVFRYYVKTANVRDEFSAVYATATADCRLDAPADNAPTNNAREIALNQLWNGHINGTAAPVAIGDAGQDVNMGGAPPAGRSRWFGTTSGVGVAPGHVSSTEVILAMSAAAAAGQSALVQDIGAWDDATAANRRLPTNKLLCLQVKARTSGGQPNGILHLEVQQWNGGAQSGTAHYRQRLANDVLDVSATSLAVAGSDILTDYGVYWGIFVPDPNAVTTFFRVLIHYDVTNWNGVNIFVTEAMLALAEVLPAYTPQMADPAITFTRPSGGAPLPPGGFDPDDGTGRGAIPL